MDIRIATIDDLERIIEINKFVDYENSPSFMRKSILEWYVLLIEKNNEIIGFLLFQDLWGNTILLSLLKIHTDFQKQGVWTKLLDYFEKYLLKRGTSTYMSSTMLDNPWAQIFHEKKWFKEIGILDMHYGEEMFYRKDL